VRDSAIDVGSSSETTATERLRQETLARYFHESEDDADRKRLSESIHEDAEMTLVMTHFRAVRGRDAIIQALYSRRESLLYSARVERSDWLDDHTLLVRGQVRYAAEDSGIIQSTMYWVDEFRDGLLWRLRAFQDEATARKAHRAAGS